MSSLAFPRKPARGRLSSLRLPWQLAGRSSDLLLAAVVMALGTALLVGLPGAFSVDSWLELVTGRLIWESGIPHHETLTALAQGAPWVDQQWLSQLAAYAIYAFGGFGLLGLVTAVMFAGSAAGSIAASRRLGAGFRSALAVLPFGIVLIAPFREVRTQEFAMPLFVAVAYLLSRDSRAPSRRVFWCLPILVLWANLHGSATLGAMLVALRGLTVAWERRDSLRSSAAAWKRPLALILGAPAAILLTPYGLSMVGYYRTTMVGSTLRHTVTEWQPITSVPFVAGALLIVAGVAIWSFGRDRTRTTSWERIALLVLAAGSVSVIRNALFFGLFAMMIVPVTLALGEGRATPGADRGRTRINALVAIATLLALAVTAVATLLRPPAGLELAYERTGVLGAVQRVTHTDPSVRLLTDERFADWLLWRDPALSGRIANDARFELLSKAQLDRIENALSVSGPSWKQGARGDRLVVLDKTFDPAAVRAFQTEPGSRVLYDDGQRIVILRSGGEAA